MWGNVIQPVCFALLVFTPSVHFRVIYIYCIVLRGCAQYGEVMSSSSLLKSSLFSSVLLASLVQAEQVMPASESDIIQHDAIIVTATRTAQTANELVSSVKVITRDEIIKSQAQSLPDLLKGMAGVHFTQSGGRGTNSSLFLRGTNSDHVIVLIDGVKVGSATSGTVAFQNLPMEQIERIEILRGPRSSLYGSEALGGVVQIFTKRGGGKTSLYSHLTFGSKDTYEMSLGLSGGTQNLFYNISLEGEKTQGIDSCRAEAATQFGGCFADEPDKDGFENLAGSARLGYRFDGGSEFSLFALQADSESEFDGNFQDSSDNRQRVLGLNYKQVINQVLDLQLQYAQTDDDADNFKNDAYSSTFDTTRDHATFQSNIVVFDRDMFTLGTDYQRDEINSNEQFSQIQRETYGLFSQYLMALHKHDFEISARYDYNDRLKDAFTGSFGYGYRLAESLRLVMSYGTAFKAPSFNELYYPNFGVPTLKPEESATFEVGLKGSSSSNSWSLVYFASKIDELIGFDAFFNSLNIDRASIKGIELELKQKLDTNWMLAIDMTAISPINQSAGANKGNLLARRPKTSSRLNLDYQADKWSAGATLKHAGTRYDDAANTKKLKAYKTLDLNAQYEVSESFMIQARIENIFDSNYETAQFYNQPGRGFFATFRYAMK